MIQTTDKTVFSFGGNDIKGRGRNDIYFLNDKGKQWTKLSDVKLPAKLRNLGITVVVKGKCILLFGGEQDTEKGDHHPWVDSNEIYIFDIKLSKLRKSKMNCPLKGRPKAMTFCKENELAVSGYLREQWKNNKLDSYKFPPQYLVKIMEHYYVTEWIHLIYNNFEMKHFKIRVVDILK